jgi:PAS domain S-box-containing protein
MNADSHPGITSAPRPFVDRVGATLGIAFLAVLGIGVLVLQRVGGEHTAAAHEAEDFVRTIEHVAQLTPEVVDLVATAVTPDPEVLAKRLAKGRAEVERSFEGVKADLGKVNDLEERERLLGDLDASHSAVAELTKKIEALGQKQPPERARELMKALEKSYAQVRAAQTQFRQSASRVEHLLFQKQEKLATAFLDLEYVVAATLLLLVLGAAIYFRERAGREHRIVVEKELLLGQVRETEMKYRSIFDNAVEGIFQTTPDGRFITANQALARMYGYASPEELMEKLTDISTQLYVDPAQREALFQALNESDVVSNFEMEVIRVDGRTIWVRENVRAVHDDAGQLLYLEGTVEDISVQWWSDQRRRLHYATAHVLSEAASVDEARPQILRTICETLEWDMGAVWDVDGDVMHCVEVWHVPEVDIADFEKVNSEAEIKPGEGLAGAVWVGGEPLWIADLEKAEEYTNAPIALACGMSSAFAVPVRVSGQVVHVLEFFSPKISQPDPELLQTLGVIASELGHMIERKRAEEALRKSEMRKAAILQSALDCIITFDLDGAIIEFNPAAERAFGYRQSDALGRDVAALIFPELPLRDERRGLAFFHASQQGAIGQRNELMARCADRSERPVELAISRIVIDGKPMFTAYLRDITERKEAERLTSELALVVANSNDAIVACTIEGAIRSWNLGAERIFGFAAEEVIGRPLHMLIPPERLDEFPQTLTAVKRGDSLANYETVRLRKDGRKISVSLTDSPIRGEGGRITGLSSIARDITERKRLEEELLQSQKMDAVGRLAGGIAHDFNNILTAILGYSDLIIGQIDERQWMFKHLTEIRKAADFAASLTHQLLAFSRRQPLFLRVFHIDDTVRNMEKMLRRVIGEHIQIVTDLGAQIGRLKADPGQLEQVLLNLCVNARDAMPKGGTITIATNDVTYFLDDFYSVNEMPAGEYVKLTVTDTGTGMSAEVKKHIFEPFFTTKEKGQGTGLGLATCYGIVKQTGGYITVDSTPEVGTTFAIYLPRVDESGEKSTIRKEVGQLPGGHETILYVEDEITVRSLTSHVLRRLGYTVLEASDGKQARDLVEANNGHGIALLFSDVVLPDAGGSELAAWFKTQNKDTRILFTSGYVDENILKRHGLQPGTAFLQKPFSPADLARKVREVMDDVEP